MMQSTNLVLELLSSFTAFRMPAVNVIKLRITILTKVRISFIITKCIVILAKARTSCPLNLMTLRVHQRRVRDLR